MAYINLNTSDILEKEGPEPQYQEGYFECDEEMAGIIVLLNRKGYKTLFSCSGHLYDEITNSFEEENVSLSEAELYDLYPGILNIQANEDGVRKLTLRQNLSLRAYVLFAPEILLPSVPEEWRLDGQMLSHNFYWDSTFADIPDLAALKAQPFIFYERRAQLLSLLYDWAEALPEYDPKAAADPESGLSRTNQTMVRMRQTYRNGPLL